MVQNSLVDNLRCKMMATISSAAQTLLSKKDDRGAIAQRNQENSPLLRLPAELRTQIYEYALGGLEVRVLGRRLYREFFSSEAVRGVICRVQGSDWYRPQNLLALSLVCRQTHAEATPIFFDSNEIGGSVYPLRRLASDQATCNRLQRVRILVNEIDACCPWGRGDPEERIVSYMGMHFEWLLDGLVTGPQLALIAVEWAGKHKVREDTLKAEVDEEVKDCCDSHRHNLPSILIEIVDQSGTAAWGRREDEY